MRIGTFLLAAQFPDQDHGDVLDTALAAAEATEQAGFDDVWVAEHHFIPYGICPSALTFAALLLGRTRRIDVGTAVSVLSSTHPVALGEQTALLDRLSGGRFRLGVGRGGPWVDLEVFGSGMDRYEAGFAESLDLLLRWLSAGRVAADGEFFTFREVAVVPRPATRPRPPVVVACTSAQTVERAAARGLPMLLGMHVGDEDKAAMVTAYATAARRHGHDPDAVEHMAAGVAYVADSRDEARTALMESMPGWLGRGVAAYERVDGAARQVPDPYGYAELLCSLHPVGTAEDCVTRLAATAERTGIRHQILMVEGTGNRERTLENIGRLGAEVLPKLR